jgi:hypothetical protein
MWQTTCIFFFFCIIRRKKRGKVPGLLLLFRCELGIRFMHLHYQNQSTSLSFQMPSIVANNDRHYTSSVHTVIKIQHSFFFYGPNLITSNSLTVLPILKYIKTLNHLLHSHLYTIPTLKCMN